MTSMEDVMKELSFLKDLFMRTTCDQNTTIHTLSLAVQSLREEVADLKQENRRIRRRGSPPTNLEVNSEVTKFRHGLWSKFHSFFSSSNSVPVRQFCCEVAVPSPPPQPAVEEPTLLSRLVLKSVYASAAKKQPDKVLVAVPCPPPQDAQGNPVRAILNHLYAFAAKENPKETEKGDSSGGTTSPSHVEVQEVQEEKQPESPRWSGWGEEDVPNEDENVASWANYKPGWSNEHGGRTQHSWAGQQRQNQSWAGQQRENQSWAGQQHENQSWAGQHRENQSWDSQQRENQSWAGQQRENQSWAGQHRENQSWAGQHRENQSWAGQQRENQSWAGKQRENQRGQWEPRATWWRR